MKDYQRSSSIKKLREDLKLTQRQACQIFDVTETTYCRWENGKGDMSEATYIGTMQLLRERAENVK